MKNLAQVDEKNSENDSNENKSNKSARNGVDDQNQRGDKTKSPKKHNILKKDP